MRKFILHHSSFRVRAVNEISIHAYKATEYRELPDVVQVTEADTNTLWFYDESEGGKKEYVCTIDNITQKRTYEILHWDKELEIGQNPLIMRYESTDKEVPVFALLHLFFETRYLELEQTKFAAASVERILSYYKP
jgi:hypothetical protein